MSKRFEWCRCNFYQEGVDCSESIRPNGWSWSCRVSRQQQQQQQQQHPLQALWFWRELLPQRRWEFQIIYFPERAAQKSNLSGCNEGLGFNPKITFKNNRMSVLFCFVSFRFVFLHAFSIFFPFSSFSLSAQKSTQANKRVRTTNFEYSTNR